MENSMVRQRYTRRPIPTRRRKRAPRAGGGSLQQIIARQLIICMILLIMIGIVKNINISATNFVTDKVKYVLSYNIELKSIFSYLEKSVIDIKRSILPGTADKQASTENQTSIDTLTSSTTPTSIAAPAISEITGSDTNTASDDETATLSSEATEPEEPSNIKDSAEVTETDSEIEKGTDDIDTALKDETVEASSSIEDENVEDSIYAEEATTDPETSVLAASSENLILNPSNMIAPVDGTLSSVYGEKTETIAGTGKVHNGIDIKVEKGSNIKAALDGKVTEVGSLPAYGSYIRIKHEGGLQTVYANCSNLIVQKGDIVKQGDTIAKIGNAGASVGIHLHFEVWKDGNTADPLEYISVPAG